MSPSEIIAELSALREDDKLRTAIEVQRWLHIVQILLPAAMSAAAAGNVTMRNAYHAITPLLPKANDPKPNPPANPNVQSPPSL